MFNPVTPSVLNLVELGKGGALTVLIVDPFTLPAAELSILLVLKTGGAAILFRYMSDGEDVTIGLVGPP